MFKKAVEIAKHQSTSPSVIIDLKTKGMQGNYEDRMMNSLPQSNEYDPGPHCPGQQITMGIEGIACPKALIAPR